MANKKKYLISLGTAFYPEKEMLRLQRQAALGWHFMRSNRWGVLEFIQGLPEEKQYAIDFFTGNQSEVSDYLAMYEAGGWQYISDCKKRYYFFQAPKNTPAIFSDQESYQERINNESKYLMKRSFALSVVGLFALFLCYVIVQGFHLEINEFFSFAFSLSITLVCAPIIISLVLFTMRLLYKNRASFYNKPEKFAKRQSVFRDNVILLVMGMLFGLLISFVFRHLI